MSKPVNVVLLCEDKQLSAFSRRFLKSRGFSIQEIKRPSSGGSRKQWITEEYPKQLKIVRQREGAALIVCTDADELTVECRIADLDEACGKMNIAPRKADEKVVMVVPKWNIETWLAYLRGEDFNENDDDTKRYAGFEKDCKKDVQELVNMCYEKQKLKEPIPNSLKVACKEYQKLK
jgi:hypothetical protein